MNLSMVSRRTNTFRAVLTLWVQLLAWSNYASFSTASSANNNRTIGRNYSYTQSTISKQTTFNSTIKTIIETSFNRSDNTFNNRISANWSLISRPTTNSPPVLSRQPTKRPILTFNEEVFSPQPRSAVKSSSSSLEQNPTTAAIVDNNCFSQMECDALEEFAPPPDIMPFLPPPPLPVSLFKSLDLPFPRDQLDKDDTKAISALESEEGYSNAFLMANRDVCNLCVWATRENDTETVNIPALGITQETTWISILVLASLASAVVGAIFMIMFLKCRKFKILPMTDSCPILPDSYFGNKSSSHHQSNNSCGSGSEGNVTVDPSGVSLNNGPKTKSEANARNNAANSNNSGTTHSTSIWNFWRRTSSSTERPLRSPGSLCSEENSYSEEPYVVSEHSSALYAELNSVSQDGNGTYRTYSMNTYSEVCDPNINKKMAATLCSPGSGPCHHTHHHHHHHHHRHLANDGTYENTAYVLSENTIECHHGCPIHSNPQQTMLQETDSLDTPSSSAYYSDSSNQNNANGRKRKKKQLRPMAASTDDSVTNDDDVVITETISANIPVANYYPPPAANFNISATAGGQMQRYRHEPFNSNSLRVVVQQQPIRIHDSHAVVTLTRGGSGRRPLPPAPPVPPPMPPPPPPIQTSTPIGTPINNPGQQSPTFLSSSNRSSIRPLPPVPSQYV
ncbi:hypothetical protein CHUAL_010182 [Chamberlinius hualienensis]